MVHAEHKAERLDRRAKLQAKLAAKNAGQSAPLDTATNSEQKQRLRKFWAANDAEQFAAWWHRQFVDSDVVHALVGHRAGPPNAQILSSSAELTASHQKLLPELSPQWLCTDNDSSGLVWLMKTRAAALQGNGVHTDDAADLELVKSLQRAGREENVVAFAAFPGLSSEQYDDGFCGLGNQFGLSGAEKPLARGEEVMALGAPRMDLLTADMRGQVVRTEVFRWAVYRQEHLYALLLDAAEGFLASSSSAGASAAGDPAADEALRQAVAACELLPLREALEKHAKSASDAIVQAARAERDRLAKKAKKERMKVKKGGMATMGCAVAMDELSVADDGESRDTQR